MRNLGLVVFSNNSGLGNQSRRLAQFMKPERLLLIDSSSFSKNTDQHPEWYEGFNGYISKGFPNKKTIEVFLKGLTHLYIIENPLNWYMVDLARRWGIKIYIASNYEFCDNLVHHEYTIPDKFLMPSYWMLEDMKRRFGEDKVEYLPPPIYFNNFSKVRDLNFDRKGKKRFLHVIGTLAAEDRNGTLSVLNALKYTRSDFELIIKSQHTLPHEYQIDDPRIRYTIGDEQEVENIYKDFDALILPRRFGGLCLPMCEALACGLPVIMTDISPNNYVLPKKWLAHSYISGSIITRSQIPLYSANESDLARIIDSFAKMSDTQLMNEKLEAFEIGNKEYSPDILAIKYNQLWS